MTRCSGITAKILLLVIAGLAIVALGCWVRAAHLGDPMRNDEAFTYISYVKRRDYFDYSRPNNHILNTLLMAGVGNLVGESPAELRVPAFVFGILLIPAVGLLCFQLGGGRGGALAAMGLAAASTTLVEYSVNARGYSLVALAAVLLACLSIRLRGSPGWKAGWVLWVICCVAGLFAIPIMIFAIAPPVLLLAAGHWAEVKGRLAPLALALLATGVITALLYAPVIAKSGAAAIVANPFVVPLGIGTIPGELAARCREAAAMWCGNASSLFLPFLCVGMLLCVFAVIWGRGDRFQLLGLAGIAVAMAAAFAQRRVAPVRAYIYLQPWMIACGCAGVMQLARRREGLRIGMASLLILISAYGWFRVKEQSLLISEDPHTYVEASRVAGELIDWGAYRGDTAVMWDSSENLWPPLLYYLIQKRPVEGHFAAWTDGNAKSVYILLSGPDSVADFIRGKPDFSRIYGEPKCVRKTENSAIYLAQRR